MNLGLLYLKGRGVPPDHAKGIVLLRNAADQNDSDAQYNLGWAYESGTGIPKDTQEAIKWYGKASDRGNTQANARLHGLIAANSFWRNSRSATSDCPVRCECLLTADKRSPSPTWSERTFATASSVAQNPYRKPALPVTVLLESDIEVYSAAANTDMPFRIRQSSEPPP